MMVFDQLACLIRIQSSLQERLNGDYDNAVFVPLFNAWCCDPVSVLALCLYAHAYELSAAVVLEL